ncbi:MAG: succinate dehydrogenase assembly factor 2 [Burkholderiales bacterium]|nr:succinate dehydrogenase assembly factor 2 [Burkholderiales bacterium]MCP5291260.1 succinate dehydrogenase assembly factor 2 [Burkholderiales bacterium]HQU62041.1 succinate dehydrogenase assembly factor 2 [Nitrosomonas sp.]
MKSKEFERARWRCRRGMLELDIILQRFMDAHYYQLSADELQQFDRLLILPDNDLWDLICARETLREESLMPVLSLLQKC